VLQTGAGGAGRFNTGGAERFEAGGAEESNSLIDEVLVSSCLNC